MDRDTATTRILAAKKAHGLTFAQIADAVGRHEVWVPPMSGASPRTPSQRSMAKRRWTRKRRSAWSSCSA